MLYGHQERTRADGRSTRRSEPLRAEVGRAVGIGRDGVAKALELALPDVGQANALRPARRSCIQVDGDRKFRADALAQLIRKLDAGVHACLTYRHERDHVGRAHPRVLAVMLGQVDQRGGTFDAPKRRLGDGVRPPHEGQHHPIVDAVGVQVEHRDTSDGGSCVANRGDDRGAATFAEVGDALDESHNSPRRPEVASLYFSLNRPLAEPTSMDFSAGQTILRGAAHGRPFADRAKRR